MKPCIVCGTQTAGRLKTRANPRERAVCPNCYEEIPDQENPTEAKSKPRNGSIRTDTSDG